MPIPLWNSLNSAIATSLAGFLTSIVLTGLLSRLGDESGALWSIRASYFFAILLVVAMAFSHLGKVKCETTEDKL